MSNPLANLSLLLEEFSNPINKLDLSCVLALSTSISVILLTDFLNSWAITSESSFTFSPEVPA